MEESVFEARSVPRAYFGMALPGVFSMVITIIYNITDTYFISLTHNTALVAGVSLCAPLFTLLMAFGNIFGQGGSSLISRLVGRNDQENLHRVSSFCFYAAIAFGIASGALMLLLRRPILSLLGADADTAQYAAPYYTWFAVGAPAMVLTFIHTNLLRAEGKSRQSMIASVGGSVVNIILDPILIFGCRLGAAGAAIATVLGYIFTDLYCIAVVLRTSHFLSIDPRKWRIRREFVGQIFGIGTSAALSNITSSFCLILTNQCLLPSGSDKIAAMGIVQKVSMVVMLVIVGFSFGGAPLVGFYYGSGDKAKLRQLLSFVLKFLCGLALIMSAVMILLAPAAIRLFLQDEALVRTGVLMLRLQVVGMVLMAVVLFVTIIFQATGKTLPAMVLSLSRQGVVFLVVLLAATYLAGYHGILMTQVISDLISAGIALGLLLHLKRTDPLLKN